MVIFESENYSELLDPKGTEGWGTQGWAIEEFVELLESIPASCWIAGGALLSTATSTPVRDIDLFTYGDEAFNIAYQALLSQGYEEEYIGKRDVLFSHPDKWFPVDLVKYRDDGPRMTIARFDLTVCQVALAKDPLRLVYGSRWYQHAIKKRLVLSEAPRNPIRTILRVGKYMERGYTIDPLELKKLAGFIQQYDPEDDDEDLEQY